MMGFMVLPVLFVIYGIMQRLFGRYRTGRRAVALDGCAVVADGVHRLVHGSVVDTCALAFAPVAFTDALGRSTPIQ